MLWSDASGAPVEWLWQAEGEIARLKECWAQEEMLWKVLILLLSIEY